MVEWRTWRLMGAVLIILFLGFMALESELIDCPRHLEFAALRAEHAELKAELQGLKENVSQLSSKLQRVQLAKEEVKEVKLIEAPGESQAPLTAAQAPQVQTQTPQPRAAKPMKCEEIKSMLTATNREATRVPCRIFHFIHVAKNGGTSIERWLEANDLRCLFHKITFRHIDMSGQFAQQMKGTCYVTFVRDPVERWISGFLSRWRRSCPSHCEDWNAREVVGFEKFPTPNKLAEAFSDPDPTVRQAANQMHEDIPHLQRGYANYFPYHHPVMMPHVIFVGHTCNLEADAIGMLRAMGVPEERIASLPPVQTKNALPAEYKYLEEQLSPLALRNVQDKVKDDYKVMRSLAEAHLIDSENISSNCARSNPSISPTSP